MGQTDFIMAIVIILGVISFSLFFVSSNFSTQLEQTNVLELKQSAGVLENKISNLIKQEMNLSKISFELAEGVPHEEIPVISLNGNIENLEFYDQDTNLLASGNPFSPSLESGTEYFYAIYDGIVTGITYNNAENITVRVLNEQSYYVLSEELCNQIDYNVTREEFNHNFKIKLGDCEIGLEPPQITVVAKKVPIIIKSDQIKKDFLNIMVW
ncbi:MAG: hypothetical protein KJ906_02835 [Nanoarchaeota archaeon]|nr:hypothetical protein [Nanoarchaeota archaeon]